MCEREDGREGGREGGMERGRGEGRERTCVRYVYRETMCERVSETER